MKPCACPKCGSQDSTCTIRVYGESPVSSLWEEAAEFTHACSQCGYCWQREICLLSISESDIDLKGVVPERPSSVACPLCGKDYALR